MKNIFILITLFYLSFQKFTLLPVDCLESGILDEKYTPFGLGRIPFFEINNVPRNTKSFAFTIEEHDAISVWYHLILTNIDKNEKFIEPILLEENSIQNSWRNNKYRQNSKPPSGTYNYHFILYALDTEYISAKNEEQFEKSIKNHIIDKAEITRVFKNQKSKFELNSLNIKNNGIIKDIYDPFRIGRFPNFRIKSPPKNTKSFAFTIEEYDATGKIWYHLILTNIDKNEINISRRFLKENSIQNSWGNNKYKQ